ncbi:MAG: hypothetical protein AABW61_01015 [Candidatus Aenigmatarchaeota archaeon]
MRRLLIAAVTLPLLYGALYLGFPVHKAHNRIKPFLEANVVALMKEQERKLGVKFTSIPKFEFMYPLTTSERNFAAEYDNNGDVIKISPASVLVGNESFLERILNKLTLGQERELRQSLHHDLSHAYLEQRRRAMEKDGKHAPKIKSGSKITPVGMGSAFAFKLLEEGIATYIERLMSDDDRSFNSLDAKDYLDEIARAAKITDWSNVNLTYAYGPGFQLVKPIIDRYGSRGIDFLLLNPPKVNNLSNLKQYQSEVMDALEHGMSTLKPKPAISGVEATVQYFLEKKYRIKGENLEITRRTYSTGNFPFDNYLPGEYIVAEEPEKSDKFYFSKHGVFIGYVYRGTGKNEWIAEEHDPDGNLKVREKFIKKGDKKKTISKERLDKKGKVLPHRFSSANTNTYRSTSYTAPHHYIRQPQKIAA